jgi:hypothetical protein
MGLGAILFALILLSVGILLILSIRKGLKELALSQERVADNARMRRRSPARARRPRVVALPAREQAEAWQSLSAKAIREAFEKFAPEDPWRSLNASRVNDAFEKFMRKS